MNEADVRLRRSITRIPVAGPAPANTLVFVQAWLPVKDATGTVAPGTFATFIVGYDGDRRTTTVGPFDTLYVINQHDEDHPEKYANTQVSVTAFLSTVDLHDDEGAFVCAVDQVTAEIDPGDGKLKVTVSLAEQEDDDVELEMAIFISAWVLTYEPHPDFLPRARSVADAMIGDDVRLGHAHRSP